MNSAYCSILSETTLSDAKKKEIKNALRKSRKASRETDVTVVSKRDFTKKQLYKLTAIVAVFVLIVGCCSVLVSSLINSLNGSDVLNPISAEDSQHMIGVAESAQYLPDSEILAVSNGEDSLSDQLNLSDISSSDTLADGTQESNDTIYDNVYKVSGDVMNFSKEEYDRLNDSLAVISSTGIIRETTISDLKDEVIYALNAIPGYDQWFMLPHGLTDETGKKLSLNSYNLSYDKESGKITMRRLSWKTKGKTYDVSSGIFYDENTYIRQYMVVEYYIDDQNREVVDCTVCVFLSLSSGEYYPVSVQRLINVKDCSLTKYAASFTRKQTLVNEIKNNKYAYDKNDFYDYGINTLMVRLDYSSENDISLLKTEFATTDKHQRIPTEGTLAYYRKVDDKALYYVNLWNNNAKDNVFRGNGYYLRIDADRLDSEYYLDNELHDVISSSATALGEIRYNYLCNVCIESKNSDDGIFIDCSHYELYPDVHNYFNQIVCNNENWLEDPSFVKAGITTQYERLLHSLDIDYAVYIEMQGTSLGNLVNKLIVDTGKIYHNEKISDIGYEKINEYVNENVKQMSFEEYCNLLSAKDNFIYDTEQNSSISGSEISIDIKTTFYQRNIYDFTPYYLCLLYSNAADENEYVILSKQQIESQNDPTVQLKFDFTLLDLIEIQSEKLSSSFGRTFTLTFAVMKKEGDNMVFDTAQTTAAIRFLTDPPATDEESQIVINGTRYSYILSENDDGGIDLTVKLP